MNSIFAQLFLAVQERIVQQVPEIKYVAHNLGQLDTKQRPPMSWPCVLLDFEDFQASMLAENVQQLTGDLVVTLGFDAHSTTSQRTPQAYREAAIGYYDLEWTLHRCLQGWSPGADCGNLLRTHLTTLRNGTGYRIRQIRYRICTDDYSAKWQQQFTPATLEVATEIEGINPH